MSVLCSGIAAIDDGRGNVYNLVLHDPNYVNTLMQYSLTQVCLEVTSKITYYALVTFRAFNATSIKFALESHF